VFEVASGSEFGVASSGGFGRNKNIFTFTLDQGAKPVNTSAEEWTGLETINDQVLETASQLYEVIGELPEVISSEHKTDEGYDSAPSPESIHSLEANNDTFILEDFSNLDKFSFNLIEDFDNTINEHNNLNIIDPNSLSVTVQPVQEPSALYNDAAIPMPVEDQTDPDWTPDFTLEKIGVINDPFLHDAIMRGSGAKGEEVPAGSPKHRRGQKRMAAAEIKDETHKKNVDRCRDYRVAKKAKDGDQCAELKQLEEENTKLKEEEEQMRQKLEKAKKVYIDLITTGRIRFV